MKITTKNAARLAGTICATTGIVTLSAMVASGVAAGAIIEGFKTAGGITKRLFSEETEKGTSSDGQQGDDR